MFEVIVYTLLGMLLILHGALFYNAYWVKHLLGLIVDKLTEESEDEYRKQQRKFLMSREDHANRQ